MSPLFLAITITYETYLRYHLMVRCSQRVTTDIIPRALCTVTIATGGFLIATTSRPLVSTFSVHNSYMVPSALSPTHGAPVHPVQGGTSVQAKSFTAVLVTLDN